MKNIHLLPTDKPSRLYKSKITQNIFICNIISQYGDATYNQHIYITSDEEIKEGDWCLDENENIVKADKDFIFNCSHEFDEYWKKIILTTDQDLIKDGVQAIDDEFLEWFCKNPSCESVEVDCWTIRTKDKVVYEPPLKEYEIIIPSEPKQELPKSEIDWSRFPKSTKDAVGYVEPKQETLEEAYTNKNIRNWWLDKTENERRLMISVYFKGGNSENIDTLYGIMPEEMEEIYNINIKEEPKQETLEEAITRLQEKYDENGYDWSPIIKLQRIEQHVDMVINIYKEQVERMYSLDDLKEAYGMGRTNSTIKDFNEKFKKK